MDVWKFALNNYSLFFQLLDQFSIYSSLEGSTPTLLSSTLYTWMEKSILTTQGPPKATGVLVINGWDHSHMRWHTPTSMQPLIGQLKHKVTYNYPLFPCHVGFFMHNQNSNICCINKISCLFLWGVYEAKVYPFRNPDPLLQFQSAPAVRLPRKIYHLCTLARYVSNPCYLCWFAG